jgi:hypothetical protein
MEYIIIIIIIIVIIIINTARLFGSQLTLSDDVKKWAWHCTSTSPYFISQSLIKHRKMNFFICEIQFPRRWNCGHVDGHNTVYCVAM